ncbi:MAG: malate dehydrogenase (quinone) [Corynebacterium sp.]|nr:malate dehydrogenase (quinone) [Corynebacterium sp.]
MSIFNKLPTKVDGEYDVILIGAGVMSATLGALIGQLEPEWSQLMIERLDGPAQESSDAWNNAGTGHSALCELNYTKMVGKKVDIKKAIAINEKFQVSRQFWAHQVEKGVLKNPRGFINPIPHMSFGQGEDQIAYLKARYEALNKHPLFEGMGYTDDPDVFAEKVPLMAEGRDFTKLPVCLSWSDKGTDVNFGDLTRQFIKGEEEHGSEILYRHEVFKIVKDDAGWNVYVTDLNNDRVKHYHTPFLFVGAGGWALPLLQQSGIPEVLGFGGFPVSGQWLRCKNPEIVEKHHAKVYGEARIGTPPMSVPHLDTRRIDGQKGLLFGPYAGWSPKFLKTGSWWDLPKSVRPTNLMSMLSVGVKELGLTKYLIEELLKDFDEKVETLRDYIPDVDPDDWELVEAGQRVQVIAPVVGPQFARLQFGTQLIYHSDGSIAAELGASPGASVTPSIVLEIIEHCFGEKMVEWSDKIHEMIPSYGQRLSTNKKLYDEQWERTQKVLELDRD